jgi:predicted nucleotidyltransferase
MKTMSEIKKVLEQQKPALAKRFKVGEIGIFGSYLRGEQTAASDLDLLVSFREPVSLLEFVHLENHLSDVLGVKVDLVMKSALKPRIGKHILEEVVLV